VSTSLIILETSDSAQLTSLILIPLMFCFHFKRFIKDLILRADLRQLSQQKRPESELNEFELRFKSAKNRFQLSAGLNLETLNTILRAASQI